MGGVFQSDTNQLIKAIDTTATSFTVNNLYTDTQYLISLRAVNELGVSNDSNITVTTKAAGTYTFNFCLF